LIGRPGESVDMTLPAIADRAGKMFTWNSDGEPDVAAQPSGSAVLSNNDVTNAFLRDSVGTSVIGRSANSSGDPADIQASANGQILARLSNVLGFSTVSAVLDSVFGSTRGMILRRGSSAWQALTLGSSGQFLKSDGTDAVWAAPTAGLPRGYIDGCILSNNGSDATNDIDFAAGVCRDSTNTVDIAVGAMTKRLDADFSAGTGNGMRYSGAAITNTTYHLFSIVKADGTEDKFAYAGTDPTAVLPSGYLYWRLLGSIVRSGGTIRAFKQRADFFEWVTQAVDYSATPGDTNAHLQALTVPTGLSVRAKLAAGTGSNLFAVISDPAATDAAASSNNFTVNGGTNGGGAENNIWTDTSGQVRYRISTSGTLYINTIGFYHPRGQNS